MLLVPDFGVLESWAASAGIKWSTRSELVKDPRVMAKYEQEMNERLSELARFERPKKFIVLDREFDLDRGEITAKLSVRRKVVEEHWASEIDALYADASAEPR
jgi:long-chain acyl-CoA synthetase